ncbi:MAG: hypothetical protein JWP82_812 [Humibacillus sp.]|nr:hypothetical protein [Humibacillus sp.]
MARSSARLSLPYRVGYRLRMALLTVLGPADLEQHNDPKARLRRERARREAAARGEGPTD